MGWMSVVQVLVGGALVVWGFCLRGWTDRKARETQERPIEVLRFPAHWKTSRELDLGEIIVDKVVREYQAKAEGREDEREGHDSGRVDSARTEEEAGSRG